MERESEQGKEDDQCSIDIIIDILLDVDPNDPRLIQWLAANSIKSATTFAILRHKAIRTWTYRKICPTDDEHVSNDTETFLTYGQQVCVKKAIWYLYHLGIKWSMIDLYGTKN